jgi:hypothetical protein
MTGRAAQGHPTRAIGSSGDRSQSSVHEGLI